MTVKTARTGRSGSPAATSARRWLLAIATALLLHGSVAAWALLELRSIELDDEADGSALPIDLTALTAVLSDDIAPRIGLPTPEVAAQQATPERDSAEPAPAEKTDLVIDQPSPADAAVALPKPEPEKTEEKKDEPDKQPPQPAVAAADAQEAAALPSVAAPPAPVAASPSAGISPSVRKSKTTWQKALVTHIDKFKRYPDAARAAHAIGEAQIEFTMDRTGKVSERKLVQGTGSPILDAEALEILSRAQPLPLPPSDVMGETFRLSVPIRFRLR